MLKQKYLVGERVQVRIAEDIVPEKEIICNTGCIKAVFYFFIGHPDIKRHKIQYELMLDKKQKYWGSIGPIVRVNQDQIIKVLG